jgi:hypothetical protein
VAHKKDVAELKKTHHHHAMIKKAAIIPHSASLHYPDIQVYLNIM